MNENLEIVRHEVPRAEAIRRFEEIGDELKLDLINDLPEDAVISIYEQGEFFDLCRGVHLPSTGKIKVFKLLSVAVLTGAAIAIIKCYNVFTVLHSLRKQN